MSMGDVGMIPSLPHKRQESLIAAHNLLKELEANESLTDDMKRVLAEMDSKLSSMNLLSESGPIGPVQTRSRETEFNEAKARLKSAEEKIMIWESNQSIICESGQEMAFEYIEAVEEVWGLVEWFRGLCSEGNENANEIVSQGDGVLQTAMNRLEEELEYILVQKRQSYEPTGVEDDGSSERSDDTTHEPGEIIFDLVDPDVVPFLKLIKKTMFVANHEQEFCAAYVRTEKEALEDCLIGLGMETLSIEELLQLEWTTLDSKIKTWVQVMKTAVQVYLRAEKRLCDEIFGDSHNTALICFVNTAKSSMTCLLTFGHAMSLGPHTPEKLFNLLDMYEVLVDLRGEVNSLFSGEDSSYVRAEFKEVLEMLGDCAKATFLRFGGVILSDPSTDPFPGGGVHPLSSYVMNYIIVYLPDYCKTLNSLLQEKGEDANINTNQAVTENSKCTLGCHLRSITTNLKSNLEKKSLLYKDVALQHVFLMNNMHYIQQKVTGSELRGLFGDEWIRMQMVSYQQHATSYVRTTWSSVVTSLRDEGLPSGSGSGLRNVLRDRIRVFSTAFEEVYKSQTGWIIRDEQLKEELRISISQRVIFAYQSFIGRHSKYDIEKFIKYDSDELEDLLRDFFEGSQKSLQYTRRR